MIGKESVNNFKNELFQVFKSQGLDQDLKTHMRARFLNKIKGQNQVKVESLSKRVICSLFLDFLKQEHFLYTPTVFVPECGSNQMTLSRPELQDYLKIPNLENESVLEFLVNSYKASIDRKGVSDTYVQTEDSPATGLESRLQQLDSEFLSKTRPAYQSFEEKLIQVRKDCESKARQDLQFEINRLKEVEISQIRIEEASKYREQLRIARNEIEDYWKNQLDELKAREKESKERVLVREKDLEVREFRQRELFEKEMEIVKTKEKDLKKGVEIEMEAARLQRRSWEQKKVEYDEKLKEMENLKNALKTKAIDDFNQYKRHFETGFDEEKRRILNEKFELQANKEQFAMEVEKVRRTEERVKEQTVELRETTKKLEFFQENYEKVMKELGRTREELKLISETSKRDLELLNFKEQELQAVKNECKAYKDLLNDQKESIKKLEAMNQVIVEKILNEDPGKARFTLESEFLAERQHLWRQIEKESLGIKREMTELVTGSSIPGNVYRNTVRPSYNTFVNIDLKAKTEIGDRKEEVLHKGQEKETGRQWAKTEGNAGKNGERKVRQEEIRIEEQKVRFEEKKVEKPKPLPVKIEHEESESYKSSPRKIENAEESINESINEYESESEQSKQAKPSSAAPKAPVLIEFSESSSKDLPQASLESSNSDEYF